MRPLISFALMSLVLATAIQPARAQLDSREAIALQNQILELRRDIQMLQDQGGRGAPAPYPSRTPYPVQGGGGDLVAQLLARVDALEEQVRSLRGQLDQTQNQVQRQGAELGKRIDDMAFSMQSGGGAPAPGAPAPTAPPLRPGSAPPPAGGPPGGGGIVLAPPPPGSPPTAPGSAPRTPEIALQEGNAALARQNYAGAEQSAREVLANRTSPRAYDAQYLLAQALAGQRQYSQAAIAYDDAYNRSRKGIHAQESLLGLANALNAINEKKAACDTLQKLRAEFPTPRPDVRDGATAAATRAGCR